MKQLAELAALLTGGAIALNVWVLAVTCVQRSGRLVRVARALLPAADCALIALVFLSQAQAPVRALAAISLALATLALSLAISDERFAGAEPAWWSSFEAAFWRYLEREELA